MKIISYFPPVRAHYNVDSFSGTMLTENLCIVANEILSSPLCKRRSFSPQFLPLWSPRLFSQSTILILSLMSRSLWSSETNHMFFCLPSSSAPSKEGHRLKGWVILSVNPRALRGAPNMSRHPNHPDLHTSVVTDSFLILDTGGRGVSASHTVIVPTKGAVETQWSWSPLVFKAMLPSLSADVSGEVSRNRSYLYECHAVVASRVLRVLCRIARV